MAAKKRSGSGKHRKPEQRPVKICPVCHRKFQWRKKWERDWEHVKYCSRACRSRGE